jgi:hypothetical protein
MEGREGSTNFDRRRFIKGAATVAWATPLILTMGASGASAQVGPVPSPGQCVGATGRPDGCPCTTGAQCDSGCCCTPPVVGGGGGCASVDTCEDDIGGECS